MRIAWTKLRVLVVSLVVGSMLTLVLAPGVYAGTTAPPDAPTNRTIPGGDVEANASSSQLRNAILTLAALLSNPVTREGVLDTLEDYASAGVANMLIRAADAIANRLFTVAAYSTVSVQVLQDSLFRLFYNDMGWSRVSATAGALAMRLIVQGYVQWH